MHSGPPQSGKPGSASLLKEATAARVSLGSAGNAIRTSDQLEFQLDHARARDAVISALEVPHLVRGLEERGLRGIALRSAVCEGSDGNERRTYLRRPDLGRGLSAASREALQESSRAHPEAADLAFVLADGLSSVAVERHALPVLDATLALLPRQEWILAPVIVVTQARVAIGDEIGQLLRVRCVVVLIGERPGLSAPDSLGAYITWSPQTGRTDAERNCISNIRPEGLSYGEAASRLMFYLNGARQLQRTGIALKSNALALGWQR